MKDPVLEGKPCDKTESQPSGPDPWVSEGLRALRDQQPSDDSKRATLARLGIEPARALEGSTAGPAFPAGRTLLRWLLWGVAVGALLLLARRFLMY